MATALLFCLATFVSAQVDDTKSGDAKEKRKYVKSFRGQDLTDQKFLKQNLDNCDFEDANLTRADFSGSSLRNCNFRGAVMDSTVLAYCDMTGSDFRESDFKNVSVYNAVLNEVNFEELDLSTIQLNERKLRGANLRNVKGVWFIYKADFYEADLRGANFTNAIEDQPAAFRKAKYDQFTRWHKNFDPKSRGLVYVESEPQPVQEAEEESPKSMQGNSEAKFKELDANEDGVLSGTEASSYKDKDQDGDGEITLKEFLSKEK